MKQVGFGNENIYIGTMHYPDRKKPSLVIQRGNQALVIGTLRNEEMIDEFEKALQELLGY